MDSKITNNAKNLNKIKFPGVQKIIRIPGVEELKDKDTKQVTYGIKYFFHLSAKDIRVLRVLFKDKSLSSFIGIEVLDTSNLDMVLLSVLFKDNMTFEQFQKLILIFLTPGNELKNKKEPLKEGIAGQGILAFLGITVVLPILIDLMINAIFNMPVTIKNFKKKREEKYLAGAAEQELNEKLFSGEKKDEPAFKVYHRLVAFLENVVNGRSLGIIVCGSPGMSKTHILRRTFYFNGLTPGIGKDYIILKGASMSVEDFYTALYKYRKQIVVFDDFDTPLRDEETVNILKSVTDSYSDRFVSLPRSTVIKNMKNEETTEAPDKFKFEGKIIIITNKKYDEIDRALTSRIPTVEVDFSQQEVIDALKDLMQFMNKDIPMDMKMEVYQYIIDLYKKDPSIRLDFRTFKKAIEYRYGSPDSWKIMVEANVGFNKRVY